MIRTLSTAGAEVLDASHVRFEGRELTVVRGRAALLLIADVPASDPVAALTDNARRSDDAPHWVARRGLGLVLRLRLTRGDLIRRASVRRALQTLNEAASAAGAATESGEPGPSAPAFPLRPSDLPPKSAERALAWLALLRDGGPDSPLRPVLPSPDLRYLRFVARPGLAGAPVSREPLERAALLEGSLLAASWASPQALRVLIGGLPQNLPKDQYEPGRRESAPPDHQE